MSFCVERKYLTAPSPSLCVCVCCRGLRVVRGFRDDMVGLRNRSTWEPLLLKASCIRSCANGCSLGVTTDLTYANTDPEAIEGDGPRGASGLYLPLLTLHVCREKSRRRQFI